MNVATAAALVAPGVTAREQGINRGTLLRWRQHRLLTPAVITAAGHARWDLQEPRPQFNNRRQRDE